MMKKNNSNQDKLAIRIFREELGLTRPQVRQMTNIAERTLMDIESGKSTPNIDNVTALARLYKKSLKEILVAINIDVSGIPDDVPHTKKVKNKAR